MIRNCISDCYAGNGKLQSWDDLKFLVIHRTDLEQLGPDNPRPIANELLDGPSLCERFRDSPKPPPDGLGTGGRPPYHFLVCDNGSIDQCLPLYVRGTHAKGYNWRSIAVAVVGRSDRYELNPGQWPALISICTILAPINRGLDIVGHTSLPGASGDPNKKCPGRYCDCGVIEMDVARRLPIGWRDLAKSDIEMRLIGAGIALY